jgi:flagellar biosynthetic protein FliR
MNEAAAGHILGLTEAQFETFLLVLVRTSTILFMLPIISSNQVPRQVRFGLALLIAFIIWRVIPPIAPLDGLGPLTAAIISQFAVGMVFGFISYLAFTGLQFAGEILDIQVGFSIVNVINPLTSQTVSVLGEFELALASIIFLIADGHHLLLEGLAGSFTLVPLPFAAIHPGLQTDVVEFFAKALFLVFQIAAPVAISLFIVNVGLALMARVAPQLNVFAVGFPLQIIVGLVMIVISMPLLFTVLPQVYAQTPRELDAVLRLMRPPG